MSMPDAESVERRSVVAEVRVEQADGDFRPVIRGYAIVYDSLSENLGGFRERIRPHAVERTLRDGLDVRALVDHDPAKILGRTRAGTLRLSSDRFGLRTEIHPPNTTAGRDIVESIRRGDVTGMSFGFRMIKDDFSERDDSGLYIREILDMTVHDVSIVTFPAYPATEVSVALRALAAYVEAEARAKATAVYRPSLQLLEQIHRQRLVEGELWRNSS
jgi:HK97 family phage prohead protease